jgi:hypothetical protein
LVFLVLLAPVHLAPNYLEERDKLRRMLPQAKHLKRILACSNLGCFKVILVRSLQHLTTAPRLQLTDKHHWPRQEDPPTLAQEILEKLQLVELPV